MASPRKLSHYVLNTNRIPAMRDWYCKVLEAEVVQENAYICFISYDDEHHRIAFIDPGPLAAREEKQTGLNHVAFNFASMKELLDTYERLKGEDIRPHWCVNHGPTTSLYYRDPDGNGLEIEIDNFAEVADAKAYMKRPTFARDPRGIDLDPEELLRRYRSGVPEAELVARS